MKIVVGEILPLALVVTLSPLNVIPVILLLFTARPLLRASCFLAGFVVGVAGVLAAASRWRTPSTSHRVRVTRPGSPC